FWANGETFRRIAHHDVVNDARGILFEIYDAHRIDIAIGGAGCPIVGDQRHLAVRHHVNVVWEDTGRHIVLLVDDLFAINLQERDLADGRFDGQRLGAVGRDRDMRDAVAHRDRVGDLYVLARDGDDGNRVVRAVRNKRQVTFLANVEPGWLLA